MAEASPVDSQNSAGQNGPQAELEVEFVRVELEPPLARVVLANSSRRNALSGEVMRYLTGYVRWLSGSEVSKVIILEGEGPAFSAGHDISEMLGQDQDFYEELFEQCCALMEAVRSAPQPVIAKVDGVATAAGCQLVAACDLAVASTRSSFATPGVKIGLFCSTPMVPVTRAVGRKRAMEMLLTAEPVSAAEAQSWGLINKAVPAEELEHAVQDLVSQICQHSPEIIALGKRTFYAQMDLPEAQAYALAADTMVHNALLPNAQEGFEAFLEKRPPQWTHPPHQ